MPDAIIFDLDGTLADTETVWDGVRQGMAADAGIEWPEGATQAMMGMSTGEWSRFLAEEVGLPYPPEEVARLTIEQMDVIELNEAFASQALATLRDLGLADDSAHVNPNGGAIALGHPLGMSGARLVTTAMYQLHRTGGRYALCAMCVGVGQGIAIIIERV